MPRHSPNASVRLEKGRQTASPAKRASHPSDATPRLTGSRCDACGLRFLSVKGFDRHRTSSYERHGKPNTRRCLTIAEIAAKGFRQRSGNGLWVLEPMSDGAIATKRLATRPLPSVA
jgi:hypothetical protein